MVQVRRNMAIWPGWSWPGDMDMGNSVGIFFPKKKKKRLEKTIEMRKFEKKNWDEFIQNQIYYYRYLFLIY